MKTIAQPTRPVFDAGTPPAAPRMDRLDLYTPIHKAIRLASGELMARLGALDADDEADVRAATAALLGFCEQLRAHVKHENRQVHPAMEARRPGSSTQVAGEHETHLASIEALEEEARALAAMPPAPRGAAALRLYRHFALFTAENFQHMHHEETAHNAVLWAAYDDRELLDIHDAILASQSPEALAGWMHWLAAALPTADLVPMLAGARAGMPPPAFDGLMALVATRQSPERFRRLRAALERVAAPASVAAGRP